ncbi:MAG: CDP-diacylglycerol--serine O-phosphatidyltransferase [Rhodospirillales bacterium]|jgi:CDP-diacylglycerol--serine O-phosphatidyltransferase|nr:CDP-diacylglycerol--serine O-phosphatidyltransferase [Rhodospirillales bacterium]
MLRPHRTRLRQRRARRITGLSINRMIPNILTLLALCAGMTAIRYALAENFEAAVVAILVAGVFDGLDGRVARLLKSTSPFGAQLDSLSDFVCFGIAPAIMLYLWTMTHLASFGWAVSLFYAICCGLRLARFNTQLDADLPPYAYNFFTGVPAPGGAGLVMIPMFLAFEYGDTVFRSPYLNAVLMAGVALLMVSRIPTISLKRFRVPHHYVVPIMLAVAVVAGFLTTAPWPTLSAVGIAYIASIPWTLRQFNRMRAAAESAAPPADADLFLHAPPAAEERSPVAH